MIITVLNKQSFHDVAIQRTGNVLNAFSIAIANGMAVSDQLSPGMDLIIPDEIEIDSDVVTYYQSKILQPATALQDLKIIEEKRGIGWMKVGRTFKVGKNE